MLEKIKKDHKKKSNQVKRLRKKLKYKAKHTISISVLTDLLTYEQRNPIDPRDYFYSNDGDGFVRDEATKKARVELLEELLKKAKH